MDLSFAGWFRCPCCGATSRHPQDVAHAYCGRCHWWTGDPELGPQHMAGQCPVRTHRSRLRPLECTVLDYTGDPGQVPAVEALLGVPLHQEANGDIVLRCPRTRDDGLPREAVLSPGRRLVRFDGPELRFVVADPSTDFMYENE